MRKKVVDKRIEQFKKDYPDYKVSKKGNLYYSHNTMYSTKEKVFNIFNVTKGTLQKLGTTQEWINSKSDYVLLITPTGKLMIKHKHKKNFKLVTMKDVRRIPELKNTYLIGRKFEYLQDYPNLLMYNFFQGFNSLKDAKIFLGFGFISDNNFYSLFPSYMGLGYYNSDQTFKYIIQTPDEEKSNLVSLLKSTTSRRTMFQLLEDYHNLAELTNDKKTIPRSVNMLRKLHDEVTDKFNESKAEQYSNEIEVEIVSTRRDNTTFEDDWKERGLDFIKLDTQRKLYLEGVKQKHCIGSKKDQLDLYSFYRIVFGGAWYDIQINTDGDITQFKGYRNCEPPEELKEIVLYDNIDYRHDIKFKGRKASRLSSLWSTIADIPVNHHTTNLATIKNLTTWEDPVPVHRVEILSEEQYRQINNINPNTVYVIQDNEGAISSVIDGNRIVTGDQTVESGRQNL